MIELANVFLIDTAYAKLRAAKQDRESFSDVVMRYVPQDLNLKEFLGSCKGMDANKLNEKIRRERIR